VRAVVPEVVSHGIVYNSESTDEVALCDAAATNGVRLMYRGPSGVTVAIHGRQAAAPAPSALSLTSVMSSDSMFGSLLLPCVCIVVAARHAHVRVLS
jgi:hypothetical protein